MSDKKIEAMSYTEFVISKVSAKTTERRIAQGIIGMASEASGELLDNLKKHMFQERDIDIANIKEECGDILFYMTELLAAIDSDVDEVRALNIIKLSRRYKQGFSKDESLNRDVGADQKLFDKSVENPSSSSNEDYKKQVMGENTTQDSEEDI